jgi:hypothetical protein
MELVTVFMCLIDRLWFRVFDLRLRYQSEPRGLHFMLWKWLLCRGLFTWRWWSMHEYEINWIKNALKTVLNVLHLKIAKLALKDIIEPIHFAKVLNFINNIIECITNCLSCTSDKCVKCMPDFKLRDDVCVCNDG